VVSATSTEVDLCSDFTDVEIGSISNVVCSACGVVTLQLIALILVLGCIEVPGEEGGS